MRQDLRQSGFTLAEAVVATAVFAFVVTSILGVYMSTLKLDTRTRALRAVSSNARFVMEFLAKEVTNGRIDYASYPGASASSTTDLYLINQLNESEHIYLSGTDLVLAKSAGSTNLNSNNVKVTNLKFYASPLGDPLTTAKTYNEQPHVTVVIELTSTSARDPAKIDLESTYSEMYYPSRQ